MNRYLRLAALVALLATITAWDVRAQWTPTGEWQCGPYVTVTVSTDGVDGLDWFVRGAWFDNHYTLRRGQLFYNATPCMATGTVWPAFPRTRSNEEDVK